MQKIRATACIISVFFGITVLLAISCAPPNGGRQSGAASAELPELTDEIIRDRLNYAYVRDVPEENGASQPITWRFFGSEPKEISVVDKQIEGGHATIILDIKTTSAARNREPRYLAGQIRTIWELKSGMVLRKWEIAEVENISMKYKNLPKPPEQNSNR